MNHYLRILAVLMLFITISSCKKEVNHLGRKILVLGNSITIPPPSSSLGWYGNWGMAATNIDKDYIHILETRLKIPVRPVNISDWEANHAVYDLATLSTYLNEAPSVVVIRLGENVQNTKGLSTSLERMIDYIKAKLPQSEILITGTFWTNVPVNDVLSVVAKRRNVPFVNLSQFDTNENVSSLGAVVMSTEGVPYKITNQAVAGHPNDIGMQKIADEIFPHINRILNRL